MVLGGAGVYRLAGGGVASYCDLGVEALDEVVLVERGRLVSLVAILARHLEQRRLQRHQLPVQRLLYHLARSND